MEAEGPGSMTLRRTVAPNREFERVSGRMRQKWVKASCRPLAAGIPPFAQKGHIRAGLRSAPPPLEEKLDAGQHDRRTECKDKTHNQGLDIAPGPSQYEVGAHKGSGHQDRIVEGFSRR